MLTAELKTEKEFKGFIAQGKTVVKFGASWCGPCRVLETNIENFPEEEANGVEVGTIDVDNINMEDIITDAGIRGVPTMVCYKDGVPVDRVTGALTADGLRNLFASF